MNISIVLATKYEVCLYGTIKHNFPFYENNNQRL